MGGIKQPKEKLNYTLKYITTLLNQNKLYNWFIGYGTLLGIIRNGSYIDNDDDIDIIIDKRMFHSLHILLKRSGIEITTQYGIGNTTNIIKTVPNIYLTSIDFYCAEVSPEGHFFDRWEDVIWTHCFLPYTQELPTILWQNTILHIPNNSIQKLKGRYGENWMIPQSTKGPTPRLKML